MLFFLYGGAGIKYPLGYQTPEVVVVINKLGERALPNAVSALGGSEVTGAVAGAETEGSSRLN